MKRTRNEQPDLHKQIKKHSSSEEIESEADFSQVVSTGSTLLDLAISGGVVRGGGIPGGIMVVAYGPSGSGKTVLACEIAGAIQRAGGAIKYRDSEARLNKKFSETFDLDYDEIDYSRPDTIGDTFKDLYKWDCDAENINGYIVDSLASLSTAMEMEDEKGDKMGMRRAKEFSEHLRKCARTIPKRNLILFCTNQIRENADAANPYSRKDVNPGGKAIEFYSSLILRFATFKKLKQEETVSGKTVTRVVGIEATIEVDKSSIWKPYRQAPVTIFFDYGIDDIRENLKFLKQYSKSTVYGIGEINLGKSIDDAIHKVEEKGLEKKLRKAVINLWEEIEAKFDSNRKKKIR